MSLTIRERILSVYRGETPDVVPFMLDLSHWFYERTKAPWDLTVSYDKPECALIDYHKSAGAGFYMPNLANFYSINYSDDVQASVQKKQLNGSPAITWTYKTPLGSIERTRVWEDKTYAWGIANWGISNEQDLLVLAYALSRREFIPNWAQYQLWDDYVGDDGVVYLPVGYSAMGVLLNYWMGVEQVVYAAEDYPETMQAVVEEINQVNLKLIDLVAQSPADIVIMGDNFSSDIQQPSFFNKWSRNYYSEAIQRLHKAGKFVAVHIDGKLKGALNMINSAGADCADAVTPMPMGDLSPAECRKEAGSEFILSGGVSPDLWLPNADISRFKQAVMDWLTLKDYNPRLIANAGDQAPPGACEDRIKIMRDLVEKHGKY